MRAQKWIYVNFEPFIKEIGFKLDSNSFFLIKHLFSLNNYGGKVVTTMLTEPSEKKE